MSYNVKVIKYSGGYQVRFYSESVGHDTYKRVDDILHLDYLDNCGNVHTVKLGSETGRISSECQYFENPFEPGEYIKARSWVDAERSLLISRNRTLNNLYYDTRSNVWEWFVTLTFSSERVNRYDYDECTKKLKNWLIACRRVCPDMRYILVPELHKDGAYHFHGPFANCDDLGFVESGHRDKKGRVIYNIGKYKLGFTTATEAEDTEKLSKYLTKYITKELCAATPGKKRYWKSRNLGQAEIVTCALGSEDKDELERVVALISQYHKKVEGYIDTDYYELPPEYEIAFPGGQGMEIEE